MAFFNYIFLNLYNNKKRIYQKIRMTELLKCLQNQLNIKGSYTSPFKFYFITIQNQTRRIH